MKRKTVTATGLVVLFVIGLVYMFIQQTKLNEYENNQEAIVGAIRASISRIGGSLQGDHLELNYLGALEHASKANAWAGALNPPQSSNTITSYTAVFITVIRELSASKRDLKNKDEVIRLLGVLSNDPFDRETADKLFLEMKR
ncbi:hypothetical protein [Paenibacillus flagellatus]|uniref:Uncharacterized protein n=1 Tax=Paenibacillus flagellatus TaxID=2211139 RepID=A0A2V5K9V8_9BACL|nr:hypothetical protein [Paenibacillus flagellatus]PYI56319.1 hypothetical protein DLM86_04895 [Paenibacillus flagellatus]